MKEAKKYLSHCVGCGKEHYSDKPLPDDQWVCLNCRKKKVKMTIKCSVCGQGFQIYWDTFRMKDPNIPWRCRRCNDDYRNALYDAKSDEEKKAFVEKQIANTKKYYANMTPEEREINHQNRKLGWEKRRENGDAERILNAMKEGRARWYNNLSEEQKKEYFQKIGQGRAKQWETVSPEFREKNAKHLREVFDAWYENLSDQEKIDWMKSLWDGHKEFWDNMTPEKYQEWRINVAQRIKAAKDLNQNKDIDKTLMPTEYDFIDYLKNSRINFIYEYPSVQIHPDFNKVFPDNKTTGGKLIDPTHMWDFLIKTPKGNILVDIDGSVHKTNPNVKFNDSKRPYQTDGMEAYVIQCHEDELNDKCPVIDIHNNSTMTFDMFKKLLYVTMHPDILKYL